MIIIISTSTEPTSSQRDPVHFEKSHTKHRGNQLMRNEHFRTDTYPALQRVLIWLAVHNSTTEQSLTDTVTMCMEARCPSACSRVNVPYQVLHSQDHDKVAGTSHGTKHPHQPYKGCRWTDAVNVQWGKYSCWVPSSSSLHHVTDCCLGQDNGQTALTAPRWFPLK